MDMKEHIYTDDPAFRIDWQAASVVDCEALALKRAEDGGDLIVRLFEPTGQRRKTTLSVAARDIKVPVRLNSFEVKTLRISLQSGQCRDVSLLEE